MAAPTTLAARADRRGPKLGLPLLLVARRDADAARDAAGRLQRRGDRVARVAACARSRATRPTCRSCTGSAASGASTSGSSTGSPGYEGSRPGADGQRRVGSSSSSTSTARCWTRSTRRACTGRPPDDNVWSLQRHAALVARGRLAARGRGDLGGARADAAFHPLEGDGVGRVRPRRPHPRGVRARRAGRALARAARRDPRRGARARLERRARRPSSSRTAPTSSTRARS